MYSKPSNISFRNVLHWTDPTHSSLKAEAVGILCESLIHPTYGPSHFEHLVLTAGMWSSWPSSASVHDDLYSCVVEVGVEGARLLASALTHVHGPRSITQLSLRCKHALSMWINNMDLRRYHAGSRRSEVNM